MSRLIKFVKEHPKKLGAATLASLYGANYFRRKYADWLEEEEIYAIARSLGVKPLQPFDEPTRLKIIYNENAGIGDHERFKKWCSPVFNLAGMDIDFKSFRTQNAEDAKKMVQEIDLSEIDGMILIGGDGLLQEVVTGLMRRPDRELASNIPLGLIPYGSNNALAKLFHIHSSVSEFSFLTRTALAMAQNQTKKIDVMQITSMHDQKTVYATTTFGVGLAGIMALEGRRSAWLKTHRYWYAGYESMIKFWGWEPIVASLAYKDVDGQWTFQKNIEIANLVAATINNIGLGRQVTNAELGPDDGQMLLTWLPTTEYVNRYSVYRLGFNLTKGKALDEQAGSVSARAVEFQLDIQPSSQWEETVKHNEELAIQAELYAQSQPPTEEVIVSPEVAAINEAIKIQTKSFVESDKFVDSYPGYYFAMGDEGLGYYQDESYSTTNTNTSTNNNTTTTTNNMGGNPHETTAVIAADGSAVEVHPIPFNIDGESMPAKQRVYVKIIPQAITVFAQEEL